MISLDVEKVSDKIQHVLMMKLLERPVMQETYLNIVKAMQSKASQHQIKMREVRSSSTKS